LANEIDPGTAAFNIPRMLQLKGAVDKHSLARAFNELIARHEILRTGLVERNGLVLQYVHDSIQFVLEEEDLSALSEPERHMKADALAVQICQTAFDLAVVPHFRAALLRLAEAEHLLVIVFHHAIIDGFSMGPFFDELAILYEAGRRGKSAVLPDLA